MKRLETETMELKAGLIRYHTKVDQAVLIQGGSAYHLHDKEEAIELLEKLQNIVSEWQ